MSETWRETAGPFFLWQIFWPFWADDAVALCVAELGPSDKAVSALLAFLIGFFLLYPFYCRREMRRREKSENQRKRFSLTRQNAGVLLFLFGFGAALSIFLNLLFRLPGISSVIFQEGSGTNPLFETSVPVQLLVMGIAAPLEEELLFRGMMFNRLRVIMNFLPAAVLSAVFFGLVHGGMAQGLFAGMAGFFLSAVYECFWSLGPVFVFHSGVNLASVALENTSGFPACGAVYVCALVCSGAGVAVGVMKFRKMWIKAV